MLLDGRTNPVVKCGFVKEVHFET